MSFVLDPKLDVVSTIESFEIFLKNRQQTHLGYPYNLNNEFCPELLSLIKYSINNLGDPFIESNYGIHSRPFEIAVLDWFANLWNIHSTDYWGYIGCSGTEGNFSGLLIARENLPTAILYASEESHYSVFKASHMYRVTYEKVKTSKNGAMDLEHFKKCLEKHTNLPAIVNVNIGTTIKGAIDDVDQIIAILKKHGKEFYIHCDGALSGIISSDYNLDFSKEIDSISVSGHKFLGCPFPCGVIIARKKRVEKLGKEIDYIGSHDTTIMGSRNGHAPVFMWYLLFNKNGTNGLEKEYDACIENAKYLAELLQDLFIMRNGITVVLQKPKCEIFIKRWQLACTTDMCHVVVMPNVTRTIIQNFVQEIKMQFKKIDGHAIIKNIVNENGGH